MFMFQTCKLNHVLTFISSFPTVVPPPPPDVSVQCLRMSKRSLFVRLVPCRCLRGEEEAVTSLDYSHCSLETVPKEIFSFEKTLLELYLDANQIEELPKVRPQKHEGWGQIEKYKVYAFFYGRPGLTACQTCYRAR